MLKASETFEDFDVQENLDVTSERNAQLGRNVRDAVGMDEDSARAAENAMSDEKEMQNATAPWINCRFLNVMIKFIPSAHSSAIFLSTIHSTASI